MLSLLPVQTERVLDSMEIDYMRMVAEARWCHHIGTRSHCFAEFGFGQSLTRETRRRTVSAQRLPPSLLQ